MTETIQDMRARLLDGVAATHAQVVEWALDPWVTRGLLPSVQDAAALGVAMCTVYAIGEAYVHEVSEWLE